MEPIQIAKVLRVERTRAGGWARLWIDGELFPYGTAGGFTVHPVKGELPGVTLTIVGWRVEVVDDSGSGGTEQVGEALADEAAASQPAPDLP
jgi:hypothetical protein